MKTILLFIFILIFGTAGAQWNKPYQLRDAKEKERIIIKDKKIRTYIDYEYQVNNDGKIGDVKYFQIGKFDDKGNLIYLINYDRQKKIMSYEYHVYNKHNAKIHSYQFDQIDLIYKTTFYYGLNNEILESVKETKFGSVDTRKRYLYSGKKIKKIEAKGPSGKQIFIEHPEYNSTGNVVSAQTENGNEVLKEIRIDYKDNLINTSVFKDFDEEIILTTEYIYKNELIDTLKVEYGVENETFEVEKKVIKRLYKTTEDDPSEFEKAFKVPDFSKYEKKHTGDQQNYVYKTPPQFPGGKEALIKYINDNLKYPKKSLKAGIEGLVIVSFVIDPLGGIRNIRVVKSVDYELDDAAVEMIKKMPKWKPALNEKEKETMSSYELPINFIIK